MTRIIAWYRRLPISVRKPAEKIALGAVVGLAVYCTQNDELTLRGAWAALLGAFILAAKNQVQQWLARRAEAKQLSTGG